jgi:hypothetical protein
LGDERGTLAESLRCQRHALERKCSGLDAEAMARRSVEPSTMSLLELVRHLAEMERATFRVMMAARTRPGCSAPTPTVTVTSMVQSPTARVVANGHLAIRALRLGVAPGPWLDKLELPLNISIARADGPPVPPSAGPG